MPLEWADEFLSKSGVTDGAKVKYVAEFFPGPVLFSENHAKFNVPEWFTQFLISFTDSVILGTYWGIMANMVLCVIPGQGEREFMFIMKTINKFAMNSGQPDSGLRQ